MKVAPGTKMKVAPATMRTLAPTDDTLASAT
jgi:hypothetical protein